MKGVVSKIIIIAVLIALVLATVFFILPWWQEREHQENMKQCPVLASQYYMKVEYVYKDGILHWSLNYHDQISQTKRYEYDIPDQDVKDRVQTLFDTSHINQVQYDCAFQNFS
ncbi:MAG: hypothetical protein JSW41_04785 [Candidatus Aenigmatarchaeota archaeon]|nr:MAG: hypothetical protein JSW41_04785 [Candidatus Aenigmarchaeota archaeon]